MLRFMGIMVDDDNDPVEENIPNQNEATYQGNGLKDGQNYGWHRFDEKKKEGLYKNDAKMINLKDVALENCSMFTMFSMFFPPKLGWVIICEKKIDVPLDVGEWLRFIGIILLLLMVTCFNR